MRPARGRRRFMTVRSHPGRGEVILFASMYVAGNLCTSLRVEPGTPLDAPIRPRYRLPQRNL
ncbi:hypothetical protein PSAC2689_70093 [Paraburkholderia sacchari]